MLRAVGFTEADFRKSQIGVASTWSMVTPCNMHIDKLAQEAAAGVDAAGGKAVVFNTITVSDGISMGTPGMRYSLVSREVIADSIETVVGGEGFDGFVAIGGCDKNMPGCVMAMSRLNRPSVFVYGGTIKPGVGRARHRLGVRSGGCAWPAARSARRSCSRSSVRPFPGRGPAAACTRRTRWRRRSRRWASACPTARRRKRSRPHKHEDCRRAGAAVVELVRRGIRPSDILTRRPSRTPLRW